VTEPILVTGPSGAGKSTVAALVAEAFPTVALVPGDAFFAFWARGFVDPWRTALPLALLFPVWAIIAFIIVLSISSAINADDGIVGFIFLVLGANIVAVLLSVPDLDATAKVVIGASVVLDALAALALVRKR
jgi:adenylate kinase family enzyme